MLGALTVLEAQAPEAIAGSTLLHGDLYHFNVLLAPGRVLLHAAARAAPSADPDLVTAMTELGNGSLRWLRNRH